MPRTGNRSLQNDPLTADWMSERQLPRVQCDASAECFATTVFAVAKHRGTQPRKLHPDLMLAPRFELDLNQRGAGEFPQKAVP
jgi:hypothetical protein